MTLFEELSLKVPEISTMVRRRVELGDPIFKLAFNGQLSNDELRMSEEEVLPWVEWEKL